MTQLKESSTNRKLCLYFIFHHSVAFRDFFIPQAIGKVFYAYYYQIPPALCDEIVWAGARGTGKSFDLEFSLLQVPFLNPGMESLIAAYRRMHVKDRMEKVISYLSNVPYLRSFLAGSSTGSLREAVSRSPIYYVKFKNKHEMYGLSTGDDPQAVNLQGKHPICRFLEEAEFFTNEAWQKYQNTQFQTGSIDRYYGVSHGAIDSPFYEMTHRMKKFKNRVFRVHRALEPNWTQDMKREKLATLKGPDSNDWLQQIEAQDGEPSFGVWNEADIRKCIDFTEIQDFPGMYVNELRVITVLGKDYTDDMVPSQVLYNLPLLPEGTEDVILGIDGGYVEPTVILPFFKHNGKWRLRIKILLLDRMISDNQAELVDYMATFYKADIGIDCTSAEGRDIATKLCNPKNEEYAGKQYDKRVYFIDFREAIVIGYKRVKGDDGRPKLEEIKDHMKNKSTSVLRDKFSSSEFDLAHDEDTIPEFLSETQKNEGGRISIHTPPDVHIPEAYRCFAAAWWKKNVVVEKPKLEEEEDSDEYGMDFPVYSENDKKLFQSKPEKA